MHLGNAQQGNRHRIADLIFDILWRPSHPLGKDDLLVLADVGNRIDGNRIARQTADLPIEWGDDDAPSHDRDHEQKDDELVLKAKPDDAAEQGAFRVVEFGCCGHVARS